MIVIKEATETTTIVAIAQRGMDPFCSSSFRASAFMQFAIPEVVFDGEPGVDDLWFDNPMVVSDVGAKGVDIVPDVDYSWVVIFQEVDDPGVDNFPDVDDPEVDIVPKIFLRVRFFKKIQDWILKSVRIL